MLRDTIHAMAPLIWGGTFLLMVYLRHRRKMAEIGAGQHLPAQSGQIEALTREHAREVALLRERVHVLERIATDQARHDSGRSLAAQIDALKD